MVDGQRLELGGQGLSHPFPRARRSFRLGFCIGISAGIFLLAGSAKAASFPDACGGANNFDYATCERVDYIAQHSDDEEQLLGWVVGAVLFSCVAQVFLITFGRRL